MMSGDVGRSTDRQRTVSPRPVWAAKDAQLGPLANRMSRYVEWEWNRARYVLDEYCPSVRGARVLEFGSYLGATAILLAWRGARIAAADVELRHLTSARINTRRYGIDDHVSAVAISKRPHLPFRDGAFDLIVCNSVLEYIPSSDRDATLKELDRVLRPGGLMVILGTSNRAWPRELHSRRWLINYLPDSMLRRLGISVVGISPMSLRRSFATYTDLMLSDLGHGFMRAKLRRGVRPWKVYCLGAIGRVLALAQISVGMLAHAVSLVLQKR
jgi:SAM-dependent methyltransferase